jgi:hypothetical protein
MSATKIAKPANLRRGLDRTADDAFKTAASPHFKRIKQTVRSFADRNDKDIAKGIQIVEILADAEDSALTIHIPLKGFINAGFRESVLEKLAGGDTHLDGCTLAVCGGRHGGGL